MTDMNAFVVAVMGGLVCALGGCAGPSAIKTAHTPPQTLQKLDMCVDNIIAFVEGASDTLALPDPAPATSHLRWLQHTEEDMVEEISSIAHEIRKRNDLIEVVKAKGYIVEDTRGYLNMDPSAEVASSDERNILQRLVAAENKDRKDLYQEVARLVKQVDVSSVERAFARARARRAVDERHAHCNAPILTPS